MESALKKINSKNFFLGVIISFTFSFVLSILPVWQLVIISAIVGGFFLKDAKIGGLASLIGVVSSWAMYLIINILTGSVWILVDQIGALLIGNSGYGFVVVIMILLIGGILGFLGGYIGTALWQIVAEQENER
ncbi:MAG: hypothetical protein GF364_13430 [Candidatus Lokiarchaeota archaeon]|nr:hypothetical protein [Candidatus Lokiarchaeota archaeon]